MKIVDAIPGQVFSRELNPQDAFDFTTCKKVRIQSKSTSVTCKKFSFCLLQRLQGDIASWETLDGWESVGKVEQLTMRSVCICQGVDT